MAIAFNAATDGGVTNTTSTKTFSHTCGSGSNRILWVVAAGDVTSDLITGVTYNSVAMTLVNKQLPAVGSRWQYLFYLLAPATGANNVVISASGTCDSITACAADYSGAYQSLQPDASTTNATSGAATLTTSLTTVADNDWIVLAHQGYFANKAPTAGTSATRRTYNATFGDTGLFDSGGAITPAASYSMTTGYGGVGSPLGHLLGAMKPDTFSSDTLQPRQLRFM